MISQEEGEALANRIGCSYMTCSALTQTGVKKTFKKRYIYL